MRERRNPLEEGMSRFRDQTKQQAEDVIREAFDKLARDWGTKINPRSKDDEEDEDYEDDDYEDDDYEDDDDGEEVDVEDESMSFEYKDEDVNLKCAIAAWHERGLDDEFVAQHEKTGFAFVGPEDAFVDYCEHRDLDTEDGWLFYEDEQLEDMEPESEFSEHYKKAAEADVSEEEKHHEDFHWGDKSRTKIVGDIEGISGNLTYLGRARQIEYFSKKQGKPEEYYHIHSEESGTPVAIYRLNDNTYVIHGPRMTVESRGIVD